MNEIIKTYLMNISARALAHCDAGGPVNVRTALADRTLKRRERRAPLTTTGKNSKTNEVSL